MDAGTVLQDGRRLFGEGKTVRGIAAAVACGTLAGLVLLLAGPTFLGPALTLWQKLAASFLLSVGAMAGDLAGSFLKRRLGYPDGTSVEVLDQLSFLAGAIAFAYPFFSPTLPELAVLAVMTYALHKLTNWAAHKLALKKVPW